jgi:hypothetical protein
MVDHMTNYLKAMKFEYPEEIPVKIGILPSAWMKYRENLSAIVEKPFYCSLSIRFTCKFS